MAIQPVYESVRLNSRKISAKKQIKAEAKTELSQENVSKVLDVSAFVTVTNTEVLSGKVKFEGKTLFNLLYESNGGGLKKCEYVAVFSGEIEDACISDGDKVIINVAVDKTGINKEGKITMYAYLSAQADIRGAKPLTVFCGGENLITDEGEKEYPYGYGLMETSFIIEEEFDLSYQVAEVLSHSVNSVITAVQSGVGCIIVDGETTLSALLLQNVDKSDIIKEQKTFPFRVEIECEEVMPSMQSIATVKTAAYRSDVTVDEETGKSEIKFTANLRFYGEAFGQERMPLIRDAYSLTDKTEVIKEDCFYDQPLELKTCKIKVNGRIPAPEIPAGSKIMAVGGERVEITESEIVAGGLKIKGVLSLKGYFSDGDGKNFSVVMESPFEEIADCYLPEGAKVDLIATACHGGARIISFSEAEIGADITLTVSAFIAIPLKVIKEVRSIGEKKNETVAISVYIPTEGEDLWSLSKRLNVHPEVLCETNKDLQFPLTGKERILIYRQK